MARRRRPAGGRGMASASAASASAASTSTAAKEPGRARGAAAPAAPARQLPLPLPTDPQPRVALPPAEAPSLSSARALPPRPTTTPAPAVPEQLTSRTEHLRPRPSRPSGPHEGRPALHAHLDDVRSALADGWEIVQPIFARPLWSVSDDSATAFNFVLRRERATRLVTVPEGRGVQRFIRDHHLAVDYRN